MQSSLPESTMPLETIDDPRDLVKRLTRAGSDLAALHDVLGSIRFGPDAVERFCHFEERHYTRNLIARTDDIELLLLCWEPGQITPIHDHAGSEGWVHCLQGEIEEVRFQVFAAGAGDARAERHDSLRASAGDLTHINDDIGWHTVANPTTERAITLHLYAGPIDSCQYFDPDSRTVRVRRMSYYSIDGVVGRPWEG